MKFTDRPQSIRTHRSFRVIQRLSMAALAALSLLGFGDVAMKASWEQAIGPRGVVVVPEDGHSRIEQQFFVAANRPQRPPGRPPVVAGVRG